MKNRFSLLFGVILLGAGSFASALTGGAGPLAQDNLLEEEAAPTSGATTTRVSVSSEGEQGNGISWDPSISANARHVAFFSEASNLVSGDTNEVSDVFVRDRGEEFGDILMFLPFLQYQP